MNAFNLLAGVPLLAIGGWLLWRAFAVVRLSRRAATWPVHPATVIASTTSPIGLYRTFPSGGVAMQLDLRYQWQIAGRAYEGTRERFTIWRLGGQTPAETWAARASSVPGATIDVHVDPDDPRQAVVNPTVDQAAVLTALLLGLLFTGYGGWMLVTAC